MKREYPSRPIVGVSAVIFDGDKVLLVKRGKQPGLDKWNLPGGAVELGERLEDALKREIREEVSVDLAIGGLVGVFDTILRDDDTAVMYHYVLVDYWGWVSKGRPAAGSDVKDLKWVYPHEAEALGIGDQVRKTIEKAARARKAFFNGDVTST